MYCSSVYEDIQYVEMAFIQGWVFTKVDMQSLINLKRIHIFSVSLD